MKNFIILFIFLFSFLTFSQIQDEKTIQALKEAIELEMKLETSIIKAAIETGSFTDTPMEELQQLFREKIQAEVITKNIDELTAITPQGKKTLKEKLLRLVKREELKEIGSDIGKRLGKVGTNLKGFFKMQGYGVGVTMVLSNSLDVVVPVILIHMGLPELIPISGFIPYPKFALSAHLMLTEKLRQTKINKLLGANAKSYYAAKDKAKKILEKDHRNYLNKIITDQGVEILSSEKPNFMGKIATEFSLNKNLNYQNAKAWALENNILEEFIRDLENTNIKKEYKFFRIVSEILNGDEVENDLKREFRIKFRNNFKDNIHIKGFFKIKKWMKNMTEASTLKEVVAIYHTAPHELNPKLFSNLWFNDLLPIYSKTLKEVSYNDFQNLVDNFTTTKAILYQRSEDILTPEIDDILKHYIAKSVSNKVYCDSSLIKLP